MNKTGEMIRGIAFLVLVTATLGWVVIRSVQKAEDPARMIFKWVLTVLMLIFMFRKVAPIVGQGGYGGALGGIPLTAACGLVLAIIWRHSIASLGAKPFPSLYDGGDQEIDPKPAY